MRRVSNPRRAIKLVLLVAFVVMVGLLFTLSKQPWAAIAYPPIPPHHYRLIKEAIKHCKIPEDKAGFIAAVAYAESTFHEGSESGAGAIGVMQLLRGTGKGVADKYQIGGLSAKTFTDPAISYKLGTCYIHYLMGEIVGNYNAENWNNERYLEAIMVAYNAGPARGRSYLSGGYGGPISSIGYAKKVVRATQIYNLDFARYEQQPENVIEPLTRIREIVWSVLLRPTETE